MAQGDINEFVDAAQEALDLATAGRSSSLTESRIKFDYVDADHQQVKVDVKYKASSPPKPPPPPPPP